MMTEPEIEEAAHVLADARLARDRFGRLPASLCPPDEASAYRIQAALHTLLTTRGEGGYAGHKIGCTTPVMQAYLNIHNPSAGGVLEREIQQSPATVTTRGTTQFGVECEVAVRLGTDLPPRPDGLILGQAPTNFDPNDLDQTTATMLINGVDVGSGRGSDILGHPLEALAWLANSLNARGSLLRAGEVVTLGSLVATNWVEAGSTVTIINDPLGEVTVRFVGPND